MLIARLSPLAILVASCGTPAIGDSAPAENAPDAETPFAVSELGRFDEPWAMALIDASSALVTEKKGRLLLWQAGANAREVRGVPSVAYAGQGGLGDVVVRHVPGEGGATHPVVYLSWAEPGTDDTRGAAVARARLVLGPDSAALEDLDIIWRQSPKVTGRGHYSHRLAFSPDGSALFIASGDRQKLTPAQDRASDLGKIIRIPLDASGRPAGPAEHYSLGHRNILGLAFDGQGRLWDLEHGPAGGDELNLVERGANYGWPVVSEGDHYNGTAIPRHATRPEFVAPRLSWTPVIAPGGMIVYRGQAFPEWRGQALIAALGVPGLVRVGLDGESARELARYGMDRRMRAIAEHADGSVWLLEDGEDGRLLKLTPRAR